MFQLQVQPNLFLSCLVPWGGIPGAGMSFARLIHIPAAHNDEAQLQTPSDPTWSHPRSAHCASPSAVALAGCVCLSMDIPKPLSFLLLVLEIQSKLPFLEAMGDAVVTKGAAVLYSRDVLLLYLVLVQTLPEPCILPATLSGKKKKVPKA